MKKRGRPAAISTPKKTKIVRVVSHEKQEIAYARKILKHAQKIVDLHKGMIEKRGSK